MHSDGPELTVYYDGACPLCDREIAFFRQRRGAERVLWVDLTNISQEIVAQGLSKQEALARLHVRRADGQLISGGAAFSTLWTTLPGFRPLGRAFQLRPLAWVLDQAYPLFLRVRPRLQALVPPRCAGPALPRWLVRELRSDHAGETGAAAIYRGILALSSDPELRNFATAHLATEREHLDMIEEILPAGRRSLLLPLWRLAGFVTGALPAVFGPRAVYATIAAVETFVDRHYAAQIEALSSNEEHRKLRDVLARCRRDEVRHRDEARDALSRPPGPIARLWSWLVGAGSAGAVALARRL